MSVAVVDEALHLRFDRNTCKEPAAKLTLILHFKIEICFALCSTHYEGKRVKGTCLTISFSIFRNKHYLFKVFKVSKHCT